MFRLHNGVDIIYTGFIKIEYAQKISPGKSFFIEPRIRHNHGFLPDTDELQPHFIQRRILRPLMIVDVISAALDPFNAAGYLDPVPSDRPVKGDFTLTVIGRNDHGHAVIFRALLKWLINGTAEDKVYAICHAGLSTVGATLNYVQSFAEGHAGVTLGGAFRYNFFDVNPRHCATSLRLLLTVC